MSYKALYRKLRPQNFSSVIGQDHIVKTLLNQINSNKISHAYLFCGTRGTGKTSTAKIFAKTINCTDRKDGNPCNKCDSCRSIDENRSMNVIEIDAASNNGVDNIREINEEVKYLPTEGFYKVYIIDEVHMLSTGAFNALLKTLEEPPKHVIFILATTEPQKVPITINSRCQRFDFKRISSKDIVDSLKIYMEKENINIEESALKYIADISDGAMRDALSILDQCISFFYNENITLDKVIEMCGSFNKEIFYNFVNALINCNSKECLNIINNVVMDGKNINEFINELINYLRNLFMSLEEFSGVELLDVSENDAKMLIEQSKNTDYNLIIQYINTFADLQNKIKYMSNARIFLEIECIKLCNIMLDNKDENIYIRLNKLEKIAEQGNLNLNNIEDNTNKNNNLSLKEDIKIEKSVPEDINKVINEWNNFIQNFDSILKTFLSNSIPGYLEGNILCIVSKDKTSKQYISDREEIIKKQLINIFSKEFSIIFFSEEEYNSRHKSLFGSEDENMQKLKIRNTLKDKIDSDINFF